MGDIFIHFLMFTITLVYIVVWNQSSVWGVYNQYFIPGLTLIDNNILVFFDKNILIH